MGIAPGGRRSLRRVAVVGGVADVVAAAEGHCFGDEFFNDLGREAEVLREGRRGDSMTPDDYCIASGRE